MAEVQRSAHARSVRTTGQAPGRSNWPLVWVSLLAVAFALGSLGVLIKDASWWGVGMLVSVIVLTTAGIVRGVTRVAWVPAAAAAVASIALLTVMYAADTAVLGIVPTLSTLERVSALVRAGNNSIAQQGIPATPEIGIVFLLAVGMVCVTIVIDILGFALRHPAAIGIPLLFVLAIPSVISPGITNWFFFVLTAATYLLVLRLGRPRAQLWSAVGVGAAVLVAVLVAPQLLPQVDASRAATPQAAGLTTGLNPILSLGSDLRNPRPITALSYSTTASSGLYLTLTTLTSFSGNDWEPDPLVANGHPVKAIPPAPGITASTARTKVTTTISAGNVSSVWLPVPYAPTAITGLVGAWEAQPGNLTVHSSNSSMQNQKYVVKSSVAQPTAAQLRAADPTVPSAVASDLALPRRLPSIIVSTAKEVTQGAATNYDRAIDLQSYFQGALFSYSTTAPVAQGYDGSGADVIGIFLQKKSGYCVHFASAMALMARVLGIPSRISVGFEPASTATIDSRTKTTYTVSTGDFHAWPELYFNGIGWVRFEPTPGRGSVPNYDTPAVVAPGSAATDTAAPSAASASATPKPSAAAALPVDAGTPATLARQSRTSASVAGWAALVLGLLALPAIVRRTRRWLRIAALRRGTGTAMTAWREVLDTAHDLRFAAPDTQTARSFGAGMAARLPDDVSASLGRLVDAVERESYAPAFGTTVSADDVRTVSKGIERGVSLPRRLRALFLPESLAGRWLSPRGAE